MYNVNVDHTRLAIPALGRIPVVTGYICMPHGYYDVAFGSHHIWIAGGGFYCDQTSRAAVIEIMSYLCRDVNHCCIMRLFQDFNSCVCLTTFTSSVVPKIVRKVTQRMGNLLKINLDGAHEGE